MPLTSLGDALTISDGTHTQTFYRVAANALASLTILIPMRQPLQAAIAGTHA